MARGKARGRVHGPARDGGGNEPDSSGRWLTTYADMVTLLMAFFVILFSMSQIDVVRFSSFLEGLERVFGNPAYSNTILDGGPGIVGESAGVEDTPLQPEQIAVDVTGLREMQQEIQQALAEANLQDTASFELDHRGLVITIATDAVLFETGSTVLSARGREILGKVAGVLTRVSHNVRVEGHTDNVPLNRNGYTNWNLSTDRAVAVLSLLYGTHHIDPKRLSATGYGEFQPVDSNETAEGRAANRRVEIIVAVPEKRADVSR